MKKSWFFTNHRYLFACAGKFLKIMKICIFIICFATVQTFALDNYAQSKKMDVKIEHSSIVSALEQIEAQSEFFFFYNNKVVTLDKKITLDLKDKTINEILDAVFKDTDIAYTINNRQIILSGKEKEGSASQQPGSVSGKVADSKGALLQGVTVSVKGTSKGVLTDANGKYLMSDIPNGAILQFSFVGMKTQEVTFTGQSVIDVVFQETTVGLEEVVVVGYGTQKKVNLTGAVDQIEGKIIENLAVPNVSRALQGTIPNLNIRFSDGRPTSNPVYNVRGLTSIGAGGEALILIDGVVGDPLNLNPKDIESVTVLKDAASSAIYGARGAFGVILITTKTPGKSKTQITYSSNYSFNSRIVNRHEVTDSYTWAKMFNETYSAWYDYTRTPTSIGASGLSFSSDDLQQLKYRSEHPGELPEVVTNSNGQYVYYGNTDWYKLLYKDNIPSMEHSLIASGSGEKVDYTISGRYFNQDGLYNIRSDQYNKFNLRFKGGIQVTDWLRITGNVDFSSYNYTDPFSGGSIWGTLNTFGNCPPVAVPFNPDETTTQSSSYGVGILYGKSRSIVTQNQFQQNVGFALSVIKNTLNIKGDFTYQNSVKEVDGKSVPVPYSVRPGVITTNGTSSINNTNQKQKYYAGNLYADFTRRFGKHGFKFLIGENIESSDYRNLYVSRSNLLISELSDFNLTTGDVFSIQGGGNSWSTLGTFSRINYDYNQKYLFEVNGRYDGSSKFPKAEQYGFFPSFSAGWRISEENFMKSTRNWLDNLKVRGSYGSLGNSQINPYLYAEQIRAAKSSRIINGQLPVYITNPAVLPDNFTWETSTTLDFGADVSLFHRLDASFDWYKRTTSDMITNGPVLPVVFGASSPKGNYADLYTQGFEFSLTWNDQINTRKPINYSVRLSLADNDSYITKFNNPQGLITADPTNFVVGYYKGMRVGDIWGLETEGLFSSADDIKNHANQSSIQSSNLSIILPGDVKFKDLNGDGKIDKGKRTLDDHGDWKVIGNTTPRYTYGATLNVDWNNFAISAFFQGIGKRDWYPPYQFTEFWGQYGVWYSTLPKHTLVNAYTLDNPDPNAFWPRYKAPSAYGERGLQAQTRYLQNARYLRLKDLSVSYTLPKSIVDKIKLTKLQIYFTGQNLWTITPIYKITKDIDPEAIEGMGNVYPMLKTYTLGFNLTL